MSPASEPSSSNTSKLPGGSKALGPCQPPPSEPQQERGDVFHCQQEHHLTCIQTHGCQPGALRVAHNPWMVFNPKLDFAAHIAGVVTRAWRMLRFVARVTKTCKPAALRTLCMAMVLPSLNYCCPVWSPAQQHLIDCIESVQRRASRTICSSGR